MDDNYFLSNLAQAHQSLESAARFLNEACAMPDSRLLLYKHLRMLRTTRNNTERGHRIIKHLRQIARETLFPTPTLPGVEDPPPQPANIHTPPLSIPANQPNHDQ